MCLIESHMYGFGIPILDFISEVTLDITIHLSLDVISVLLSTPELLDYFYKDRISTILYYLGERKSGSKM